MITAEKFVRVWQSADSLGEVAKRLGVSSIHATARAALYRRKGIPLQKFSRHGGRRLDVAALAALAKSIVKRV